jgi:hypothetical protein
MAVTESFGGAAGVDVSGLDVHDTNIIVIADRAKKYFFIKKVLNKNSERM